MTIFMPDFLGRIRIISYLCRMRAVIQRVSKASVTINGTKKSEIGQGFLILLGVCNEDTSEDVDWLVRKVANLRVFDDEQGVMNRSMLDINSEALVVSQFTHHLILAFYALDGNILSLFADDLAILQRQRDMCDTRQAVDVLRNQQTVVYLTAIALRV